MRFKGIKLGLLKGKGGKDKAEEADAAAPRAVEEEVKTGKSPDPSELPHD